MTNLIATQRRPTLDRLDDHAPDALLALIQLFRADPRRDKIDLGVGVFRDEDGATPIMHAVKTAEARLLGEQTTKAYLGSEGNQRYTDLLALAALGASIAGSPRLTGLQTPGGTGALRLGAELIARAAPDATVWMSVPTWPNHTPIFEAAGLRIATHRFHDGQNGALLFDAMLDDLGNTRPGDILLLHGCCHNPTGQTLDTEQWAAVAHLCEERGLTPFIDLAYQGLGDGWDADGGATRLMLEAVPEALVAYSCDKNFGLYRERVGALWVLGANEASVTRIRSSLLSLSRSIWSMPPDHGAAVVRTILEDDALTADWRMELDGMRQRINGLRTALGAAHPRLAPIALQRGMFAMLPLDPATVAHLRDVHGIYMAGNGRINIAGLRDDTIPRFIAALEPHL